MKILVAYKNGTSDEFKEEQIDSTSLTMRGHASKLIDEWRSKSAGVYVIDSYNAVLLDEIISIRIV